ncbi:hypothetical protein FGO68_gene7102 [Halteria grandinella]|uniref:Uncharacterized protein n=1 Tax=Halteria grandinella TaxID=5974 RepID=A0A8J8P4L5_HALGN|nr:hypothetical protein FGO68_gene7102 [Halteria grandinella]
MNLIRNIRQGSSNRENPSDFEDGFTFMDLIQCPHCLRKFSNKLAESHIKACKNIKNRPKPPPTIAQILNHRSLHALSTILTNKSNVARNNLQDVGLRFQSQRRYAKQSVRSSAQASHSKASSLSPQRNNNLSLESQRRGKATFIPSSIRGNGASQEQSVFVTHSYEDNTFLSGIDVSTPHQQQSSLLIQRSLDYAHQIQCPHCSKFFSKKAGERHINICANIINKPSRLKRNTAGNNSDYSARVRSHNASKLHKIEQASSSPESGQKVPFKPRVLFTSNLGKQFNSQERVISSLNIRNNISSLDRNKPLQTPQLQQNKIRQISLSRFKQSIIKNSQNTSQAPLQLPNSQESLRNEVKQIATSLVRQTLQKLCKCSQCNTVLKQRDNFCSQCGIKRGMALLTKSGGSRVEKGSSGMVMRSVDQSRIIPRIRINNKRAILIEEGKSAQETQR